MRKVEGHLWRGASLPGEGVPLCPVCPQVIGREAPSCWDSLCRPAGNELRGVGFGYAVGYLYHVQSSVHGEAAQLA